MPKKNTLRVAYDALLAENIRQDTLLDHNIGYSSTSPVCLPRTVITADEVLDDVRKESMHQHPKYLCRIYLENIENMQLRYNAACLIADEWEKGYLARVEAARELIGMLPIQDQCEIMHTSLSK
jgi:hypothetical protein